MPERRPYSITRSVECAGGGNVSVTVSSSDPIDERDYLVLRPDAMLEFGEVLGSLAESIVPPEWRK